MNIVYVIAHPGFAGSEKYSVYLAGEAQKNGNQVGFIVGEEGPLTKELKSLHLSYRVLPMQSSFNPLKVLSSALGLKKVLKEVGAEVVHTNMLREQSLAIISKILGSRISIVRTYHRLDNFNWKMKPLMWLYNAQTGAFIAVSSYMGKKMMEGGINEKKISVIYNGNPDYKVVRHNKKIGFLGRIAMGKGILELARVATGADFIVAGEGPDLTPIKELKKKNIKTVGAITDLKSFFESVSVLVLPTKAESTLPLSVTEGFSAGIPTIIFDIPTLENETIPGLIKVHQGDYEEMWEKATCLINNPKELEKISKEARETYENRFRISRMWKETNCLYKNL